MSAKHEGDSFRERFGPWAVVAGGSDGIGAAFARDAARRGLNVALDHLGKRPNFVPGAGNQAAAKGLWPLPRVGLINAMSQAAASLFGIENQPVAGIEFDEN